MEYGEWGMGDRTSWAEVSSEVDFNTVRASKACCRCDCRTLHAQPMGKASSPSLRTDRPGASWPFHPCPPRGVKEPYSGTLNATLTVRGDLRENAEPLANLECLRLRSGLDETALESVSGLASMLGQQRFSPSSNQGDQL